MALEESRIRTSGGNGRRRFDEPAEPPLGELFRDLSTDASALVRQEIALAKAELRESARQMARDAAKVGVALVLAWFGAMAAVAFLIAGLGAILGSYWLSALIVAALFLGAAAVIGSNAKKGLQRADLKPAQTVATLREDARWARQEAREFKEEMRSGGPPTRIT